MGEFSCLLRSHWQHTGRHATKTLSYESLLQLAEAKMYPGCGQRSRQNVWVACGIACFYRCQSRTSVHICSEDPPGQQGPYTICQLKYWEGQPSLLSRQVKQEVSPLLLPSVHCPSCCLAFGICHPETGGQVPTTW